LFGLFLRSVFGFFLRSKKKDKKIRSKKKQKDRVYKYYSFFENKKQYLLYKWSYKKFMSAQDLPSILVPLVGLVFPAVAMASLFLYVEKEEIN
jgi:photosystem I subunit 8